MASVFVIFLISSFFALATSETHFLEKFKDGDLTKWTKGKNDGVFILTEGKFYGDEFKDEAVGIQTSQDAKFYSLSRKFTPFSNKDKDLILQFQVKHEQNIDCGGGYIKLLPGNTDLPNFNGDSKYYIMFGPDICGSSTKKVHVIFGHNDASNTWKNFLVTKDIKCEDDDLSHVYTLILKPDNTYTVKIDGKEIESGSLKSDFGLLPPAKIKDPKAVKPEDWDDKKTIPDPDDKKPEDFDKPEKIPDPKATKPEDWDDEMDGDWTAPLINNPDYKGEWKPKQIDNPNYKGPWIHPEIDNPEFKDDNELYLYKDIGAVGFDLWQVKSGTIFDNIIVTDDIKEADELVKLWESMKDSEKAKRDEIREVESKKLAEESKSKDVPEDKDEEDDEEEKESEMPDDGAHDEL